MVILFLIFWRSTIQISMVAVPIYNLANNSEDYLSFITLPTLSLVFLIIVIPTDMRWYLIVYLICISLMIRGEWKSWLKAQHSENEDHGIWPITSWEIDGQTVETVSDFIFLDSNITADGDCSHEIKRH